jgi:hypothetical protein
VLQSHAGNVSNLLDVSERYPGCTESQIITKDYGRNSVYRDYVEGI